MNDIKMQHLYDIANKHVNAKSIAWDDLPDINSLWDWLDEDMTDAQAIEAAKLAYSERFTESANEMGFSDEDIEGMLDAI